MLKIVLSLFWIIFCFIGIANNWTHYNILDFIIVIAITVSPFVIYKFVSKRKLIKNNKSKEPSNIDISQETSLPNNQDFNTQTLPTTAQNTDSQPQTDLPNSFNPQNETPNKPTVAYSEMQVDNDLRILNDCINLMQSTNNLETFFSRYELAIQKSLALEQAGTNLNPIMTSQAIMQSKNSNLERILQTIYEKELTAINGLKTNKGKINRIDKLLETLSNYKADLQSLNNYKKIAINLHKLKKELTTEQNTRISEEYQETYQRAVADAERIQKDFNYLKVERYQILGESDCKHYKICKNNNNKVYYLSEYKIGKTAPPFHEQCTCTVVPYFDD